MYGIIDKGALELIDQGYPQIILKNTTDPVDQRAFRFENWSEELRVGAVSDDYTAIQKYCLRIERTGNVKAGGILNTQAGHVVFFDTATGKEFSLVGNGGYFRLYSTDYGQVGYWDPIGSYTSPVGLIQAGAGFYERGRAIALGEWIDFTPVFSNGSLISVLNCSFMLVGKTMFLNFYLNVTSAGGANCLTFTLPAGVIARGYIGVPMVLHTTHGMAHTAPGNPNLFIYKDVGGSATSPAGNIYVAGLIPIPIQ